LTFCKMAVEAHGGIIGVNSVVGKGSTFWFRLPQGPPAGER
jgi:two-component system, sensor histidine kinase and response regulator